jgi:ribosomal-protein-alanine N-acetyltransferase
MIAPPDADDLDRIMAVMTAAFPPEFGEAWTRRQLCDALSFGSCHYQLVDYLGEPPLGDVPAAGFALSRSGYEEEELLLIAVTPKARRRGLALTMLRRTAQAARVRGAGQLLLEMRRGNPAEALYRNLGFIQIGERPKYYRGPDGTRIDAITFALCLN